MIRGIAILLVALGFALAVQPAWAQVAPSAGERAAYTGLHRAASMGDANAIRQLLANGADPKLRDRMGRTPLHVAAFGAHGEALRALVAGGGDVNALENDRYDVITIAAVADDVATLKLALELGGNPKLITSRYNGTALIAAAHLGHDEVVKTLIAAGAPLDHVNNLGWTALMESVVLGNGGARHRETARALLAAGANRAIGDRGGVTPLQHAQMRGLVEMAALLK